MKRVTLYACMVIALALMVMPVIQPFAQDNINVRFATIDVSKITATADEVNVLDGITSDVDELNYTDITTAGLAEASKALVLDSDGSIAGIVGGVAIVNTSGVLTADEYGKTYYAGATMDQKCTLTLPSAAVGGNYEFIANDSDSLLVTTATGDTLLAMVDGAWTKYKTVASVAAAFRVLAVSNVYWCMLESGAGADSTITGY